MSDDKPKTTGANVVGALVAILIIVLAVVVIIKVVRNHAKSESNGPEQVSKHQAGGYTIPISYRKDNDLGSYPVVKLIDNPQLLVFEVLLDVKDCTAHSSGKLSLDRIVQTKVHIAIDKSSNKGTWCQTWPQVGGTIKLVDNKGGMLYFEQFDSNGKIFSQFGVVF